MILPTTLNNASSIGGTKEGTLSPEVISSIVSEVWNSTSRTLTQDTGIDEAGLHSAMDTYTNKADWGTPSSVIRDDVWGKIV